MRQRAATLVSFQEDPLLRGRKGVHSGRSQSRRGAKDSVCLWLWTSDSNDGEKRCKAEGSEAQ